MRDIIFNNTGPDEDGLQQMLVTIPVYHGEPSTSGQNNENKENELLPVKNKEVFLFNFHNKIWHKCQSLHNHNLRSSVGVIIVSVVVSVVIRGQPSLPHV